MADPAFRPRSQHATTRRVEFADTDMAGIVHFARFFVFMETAEHELLRALGIDVHFRHDGRLIGWPRLEASCRYLHPARLGDLLEIDVRVLRKGRRSLTYGFAFRRDGRAIAEGRIATICCALDGDDGLEPIPIPAFLAERIAVAPPPAVAGEPAAPSEVHDGS